MDHNAGRGSGDPVAALGALLRATAEVADGIRGRRHWDSLTRVVKGPGGDDMPGAAELAGLRQEPAHSGKAEDLARALLVRASRDEEFNKALNSWMRQERAQKMESAALGAEGISADGPLPARREVEQHTPHPGDARGRMKRIRDSLVWLGGGDRSILDLVPYERNRFTQMAVILLVTAGLAVFSMIVALRDAVNAPFVLATVIGIFWGFFVLNIDRWLVVSLVRSDKFLKMLWMVLPRLLLDSVLSFVVYTPFILSIFEPITKRQLKTMHVGTGIAAQLKALSRLASNDASIKVTILLFYGLLFLISILPILIKIISNLGPISAYESVAIAQRDMAVTMAQQEDLIRASDRTLRRDLADSLRDLGLSYAVHDHAVQALGATREAAEIYRGLAATDSALTVDLAGALSNLGALYGDLGRTTEAVAATQEAVAFYRDLGATDSALAVDLAGALSNLGALYGDLGRTTEAVAATQEAATLYRDLGAISAVTANMLSATTANLAAALQSRYRASGDMQDLQQATLLLRKAIEDTPDDHPNRPVLLSNLAAALQSRYRATGDIGDLEQAIELQKQALSSAPSHHPDRPIIASKLAALGSRRGVSHD